MGRSSLFLAVVAVLVASVPSGCASKGEATRYAETMEQHRVDAERQVAAGDPTAAEAILAKATALPMPAGAGPLALRQDALFAQGRLAFEAGRFDAARQIADRGLALGQESTLFVANLYALRGLCREAEGQLLDAVGDLEQAQLIHTRLFDAALPNPERSE